MPNLYGKAYTKADLLRRVGDMSQIARVRPSRLLDGREDGVLAVDFTTGSGLEFTVVPSRGMDISSARFKGHPLAWRSPNGDAHPAYYEPDGLGWLRTFPGGLLTTCGLTWMGGPCNEDGADLGLHGRVSHIPATHVRWEEDWVGEQYEISVSGRVRESIVFGANVEMRRRISARLGESVLRIDDVVTNLGHKTVPHMILYHINVGFPIVSESARLISSSTAVTPRDGDSDSVLPAWNTFDPPTAGYRERVYFHQMAADRDGMATAALVNPGLSGGLGVRVRYDAATLPHLVEWKMMGEGTYVVGLEPANAWVLGRPTEREAGRLLHLEAGESRAYRVEIGVVEGAYELAALENGLP